MADHVLGFLARRFTVSEENLATEALTWILRDPAANSALCALARSTGAKIPNDLTFIGQAADPETGRPDIVGTDGTQAERLLIEAKFGARLTDQQPLGYLSRLSAGSDGLLLVVAPSARMQTLWSELLRAVPSLASSAPSPSVLLDETMPRIRVGDHATLALTSWRFLVTNLLDAVMASGDRDLGQDVEQLLALTEVMDSQAYAPVVPGDYGPDEARRIQQLESLIDGMHDAATASTALEHEGRASHGRIFYGWYLRSKHSGKAFWYGFHPRRWSLHGISPLWIELKVSPSWSRARLALALATLHDSGGSGVFEDGDRFYVPLRLQPFLSKDQAIRGLLNQSEHLTGLLDAAVPSNEEPTRDVIDQSDNGETADASDDAATP